MKELQILSAPGSHSADWLANVLLELDVRVSPHVSSHGEVWVFEGGSAEMRPESQERLRRRWPALEARRRFEFEPDVHVRVNPPLPNALRTGSPTLILVEDPRAAIARAYAAVPVGRMSLEQFLLEPVAWDDAPANLPHLPPSESWALWHWIWLAMAQRRPVAFVDAGWVRARPMESIPKVLEQLGTSRSDKEILRATSASAGIPQSFSDVFPNPFSGRLQRFFEGPTSHVMATLGFRRDETVSPPPPALWDSCFDAQACSVVRRAQDAFRSGRFHDAERELEGHLPLTSSHPPAYLLVASTLLSMRWAAALVGPAKGGVVDTLALQEAFAGFLGRFVGCLPIQRRLWAELDRASRAPSRPEQPPVTLNAPVVQKSPPFAFVQRDYKGFDIVACQSKFWGIARSLGELDPGQLAPEQLRQLRAEGKCFVEQFTDEVREQIDRVAAA